MNRLFEMRTLAHAHHGGARLHDRPRQEAHEDMLRTIGVVVLVGAIVVMALAIMILHPDMNAGTGFIMNQLDPARTVAPWGTPSYNQFSAPFLPYPLDGAPLVKPPGVSP